MTPEQAINYLTLNKPSSGYPGLCEAIDMAIAALRDRPAPPDALVAKLNVRHDEALHTAIGWMSQEENLVTTREALIELLMMLKPVIFAAPAPVAAPAPETPAPVDVPACPDGQHSYRRNAPPQNGDVCFVCRKSIWWETPAPDAMPEIQVGDRIGWRHRQTGEVFDTPERRHRVGVPQAWPHGGDEVCELLSIERNGVVIWRRRQEAQP